MSRSCTGGRNRSGCRASSAARTALTWQMRSRDVKKLYQDFLFYVGGAAVNRIRIVALIATRGDAVLPGL